MVPCVEKLAVLYRAFAKATRWTRDGLLAVYIYWQIAPLPGNGFPDRNTTLSVSSTGNRPLMLAARSRSPFIHRFEASSP